MGRAEEELYSIRKNTNSICTMLVILILCSTACCNTLESINQNLRGLRDDLKARNPTTEAK